MKRFMSVQRRNRFKGYLFVSPWIIGFLLFTLYPIFYSVLISLNSIQVVPGNIAMEWKGLEFYNRAFNLDPGFKIDLGSTVFFIVCATPLILVFALIIALLLNGKYRFRTFFRAVFFLPVIIMSGPVISKLLTQHTVDFISGSPVLYSFVQSLPSILSTPVMFILNNLVLILWFSGVPILIFLSGVQKISPDLYEAAEIDGAGGWEKFWKITLPHLQPFAVICTVYTIIDLASYPNNAMNQRIANYMFSFDVLYSYSSAMAWMYFVVIAVILSAAYFLFVIFGRRRRR